MPFAKFTRVREVSSEDKIHTADNLIGAIAGKKWRTKTNGEKSAYVILELYENQQICGIDIGNEHSAFAEVLVSKGSCDPKDFTEILVTCSFMTPIESKNSTNPHRVRCFNLDALVPTVASEKWSLVKIVCTQPFNKHVQYGLSFIKLHVVENKIEEKENSSQFGKVVTTQPNDIGAGITKQIGKFNLRQDCLTADEGNDSTLFKRWQKCKNTEESIAKTPPTPSSKQLGKDTETEAGVAPKKARLASNCLSPTQQKPQLSHFEQNGAIHKKSENELNFKEHSTSNGECSKRKVITSKDRHQGQSNSNSTPRTKKYKPFNQLFQGVVFAFSGIQNPERSELRNKAIALGAKYKADWDHTCTHLICAFKNTPKYNQVKGKGKIVLPKWISECYNSKKYAPWRRFALDISEANKTESDEEVLDESLKSPNYLIHNKDRKDSMVRNEAIEKENKNDIISLYDLDDSLEINGQQPKKAKLSTTTDSETDIKLNASNEQTNSNEIQQDDSMDIYNASTDEEDYLKEEMKACA